MCLVTLCFFLCFETCAIWFSVNICFVQHTAGQIRNRKPGGSGGAKASEPTELITFADVAGVDEAKEELEEIVVCWTLLSLLLND
jgi:ATP-dependent Zn protease